LQSAVSSTQPQLLQRKNDMVSISCLRPQHSEETSIAAEIEFGVVTGNGNLLFHAILSAKPRSPLPLLGHFSRPLSAAPDCTRWFQLPAPVKIDEHQ